MTDLVQLEAAAIRAQWLGRALSTLPADRPAAEAAISALYRLIGRPPPRFHWVASPLAALATAPVGLRPSESTERVHEWPLRARFSEVKARLCGSIDALVRPAQLPIDRTLRQEVQFSLLGSVSRCLLPSLQRAHSGEHHTTWYNVQYVNWVAYYDALHRVAGVAFTDDQRRQFDLWTAVARSCHWWWPGEHVCVVSERPVALHTETGDGGAWLHHAGGPAVRYGDGWSVHAWHGTVVPSWVIEDPTVERIAGERNVEVRRCAIEKLGWGAYIEQAGLRLLATAPDPGNPGSELRLYDMRRDLRVLLAVNGSVERDGRRRKYGLTVPAYFDDPISAAGWTYGLSGEQYSRLLRRT
ncbi:MULTISPECIES: DUF6745 domain-containing protein [unclassified Nonomuraea]|uniref:DUF6745 domain-containing protein n=1 Tax=unclassified Nonomuraea TaxID=2593643 RepID=UPI0035C08845